MTAQFTSKPPKYGLHRGSGQAVVYIQGRARYLGKYQSPESHEEYARVIAEWSARPAARDPIPPIRRISINQVLLCYFEHAKSYYVDDSGAQTNEYQQMLAAARPLRKLYGRSLACEFGPKNLKSLRQCLVDEGTLCRQVINRRINRIKRIFKWAVSEELAPPNLYDALRTVDPLRRGRTTAREALPVKPVPPADVDAVFEVATPQIAAMIQLQLLGGMRPQDVVQLRPCDIDQTDEVWTYLPQSHKTQWRGHSRKVYLGPQAQTLLTPFLNRDPCEYLFSPAESERWRNEQRRQQRKAPVTPSQAKRRPKKSPKRAKRNRYDVHSYARAIHYAIQKVNRLRKKSGQELIPNWSPNQLRHSRATEIRRLYGLEAAQLILGQKHARVTEVYAERDEERAKMIQREVG